jgi:DNA-directed RNA polymerase specialized sigma24 family protein
MPGYDPQRPLRSWLYGIVFRVASEYRREGRRRYEVLPASSDLALQRRPSSDPPFGAFVIHRAAP